MVTRAGSSAWSIWPGRVHVRNYQMRFREPDVELFMTLDQADVTVDLSALFRRTFRATRVRGHGLVMRVRPRYFPTFCLSM